MLVRPDVADRVGGGIRVAVGMTIETGDSRMRLQAAAVLGGIELLLGKGGDQQSQSIELLGIQDVLVERAVVVEGHQSTPRDVSQVGTRGQVDRGGEFREEVIGQVEIEVEARQVSSGLPSRLCDEEPREHHPPRLVVGVRQWQEGGWPELAGLDLLR